MTWEPKTDSQVKKIDDSRETYFNLTIVSDCACFCWAWSFREFLGFALGLSLMAVAWDTSDLAVIWVDLFVDWIWFVWVWLDTEMFPLPKDKSYLKNIAQSRAGARENFTNEITLSRSCYVHVGSGWQKSWRRAWVVNELNVFLQSVVELKDKKDEKSSVRCTYKCKQTLSKLLLM